MSFRHSSKCPCFENIQVQTEYFSDFVQKLNDSDKVKQTKLLLKANPCFIRFLERCAKGVLEGHIKLSKTRLREISPDKKILLKLISKSSPIEKKQQIFANEQKGGFLGILSGIAATALSSLLAKEIGKYI